MLILLSLIIFLYATPLAARGEPQHGSSMSNTSSERLESIGITNQTFLSPEEGRLPPGAYIVPGWLSIIHFAEYLDAHPEVQVTHLLISDTTGDKIEDMRHDNAKMDQEELWDKNVTSATERILHRVALSLKALSYLIYSQERLLSPLPRHYPRLTHFTLQQRSSPWIEPSALSSLFPGLRLPALIHLIENSLDRFPSLASLCTSFPSLTHIRFTGAESRQQLPTELIPQFVVRTWIDKLKDRAWFPYYKMLPM